MTTAAISVAVILALFALFAVVAHLDSIDAALEELAALKRRDAWNPAEPPAKVES